MAEKEVVTEVSPPPSDHKIKHKEAVNGGDCDSSEAKQPRLEDKPDDLDFNREPWVMTSIRGSVSRILGAFRYMGRSGERKGKDLEVEDEDEDDDAALHEYHNKWDDDSNNNVRDASAPPPIYNWDIIPPPISVYTGSKAWDWDSSDEFDNNYRPPSDISILGWVPVPFPVYP